MTITFISCFIATIRFPIKQINYIIIHKKGEQVIDYRLKD